MAVKKDFHIAIIGGGIAGLTLAIALHMRNIPIAIYEQAAAFGEIGAGVSFSPNAVLAMKSCHQGVYEAFQRVCTKNRWESKQDVWFDFLDGMSDSREAKFTIRNSLGQQGVHRASFLDEIVKLLPEDIARFGKKLAVIEQGCRDGRLTMSFEDGTTAEADAVVGCDGIKSTTRKIMFGHDHPCAKPSYTHKYAYRGLAPMDKAIEAVGEEVAVNACMHVSVVGFVWWSMLIQYSWLKTDMYSHSR
jgi:salicylate hydroxylase